MKHIRPVFGMALFQVAGRSISTFGRDAIVVPLIVSIRTL